MGMIIKRARIYQPTKTAMQSGRAKTRHWVLEYSNTAPNTPNALMGWPTMVDTLPQIKLQFSSKDDALAYAAAKNIQVEVEEPHTRKLKPKSYAANFAHARRK